MNVGVENPVPPPAPRAAPPPAPPPPAVSSSLWHRLRSVLLMLASFGLTGLVVANAYYQRQQFYPSVVYITKSNPSMAVIYAQSFVFVILFGKLVRKIFFGQLRASEVERLVESFWYVFTETGLTFTMFRDDISANFVVFFTVLVFLKIFHWLTEDRIDYMEQSPNITGLFHLRMVSLMMILATVDFQLIAYAYTSTVSKGPSVQLVFAFEYAILLTILATTAIKYVLHVIDLYGENPWEDKAVFMLYTEVVIGFIKSLLYMIFMFILVRTHTFPVFAFRPMYQTLKSFKRAFNGVLLSRRAIHVMNTCYPNATPEELANTDNVCIICREEMNTNTVTKKLPCNHIFHKSCLRSWFQRQQTCPTCRLEVLEVPGQNRPNQPGANNNNNANAANNNNNNNNNNNQGPQQQPRPGQFPMFDPNMFMQGRLPFQMPPFPGVNNMGGPAGRPGPVPTRPVTTQPSTSGTTTNSPPGATGMSPPPFFPMPPFFGAPFGVPPPLPPLNFAGLTDDELRAMEGQERQNVEARVRCLRNIQILLDAAVMEMQQYSSVAARLQPGGTSFTTTQSTTTTTSTTQGTTSTSTSMGTTSTVTTSVSSDTSALLGARPRVVAPNPSLEKEAEAVIAKMDAKTSPEKKREDPAIDPERVLSTLQDELLSSPSTSSASPTRNIDSRPSRNDEQDEIRRRRLALFEQQTQKDNEEESKKSN